MNTKLASIINIRDGKPVSLSCVINGKPYALAATHPSFVQVVKELKQKSPDIAKIQKLMSKAEALKAFCQQKVIHKDGKFFYRGEELKTVLVQRIQEFMRLDLPWKPMFRFLENLMANPSATSRNCLFTFLENENLPLTPDGCFLAYKGAQANFWSKYTGRHTMLSGQQSAEGRLYYAKGEKLRIPWDEVVADPQVDCARGMHIGSFNYAKGWAGPDGALVLAKINPKDVVSVTTRCKEVMRVCAMDIEQSLPIHVALRQAFEPQFLAQNDEDASSYRSVRGKDGRFIKAKAKK